MPVLDNIYFKYYKQVDSVVQVYHLPFHIIILSELIITIFVIIVIIPSFMEGMDESRNTNPCIGVRKRYFHGEIHPVLQFGRALVREVTPEPQVS